MNYFILVVTGSNCCFTKVPHVATINLCQKMPDNKKRSRSIHSSSMEKTSKMSQKCLKGPIFTTFGHFLSIEWSNWPESFCILSYQASSGTSLEYQHGVLWWNLKINIFFIQKKTFFWHTKTDFKNALTSHGISGRNH